MPYDTINEATVINGGDRTYTTNAQAALEGGLQSKNTGDEFWGDFEERTKLRTSE